MIVARSGMPQRKHAPGAERDQYQTEKSLCQYGNYSQHESACAAIDFAERTDFNAVIRHEPLDVGPITKSLQNQSRHWPLVPFHCASSRPKLKPF